MSTAGGGSGAGADAGADDLEKVTLLEVPLDEAVGAIDQACGAAETAALAAAYQDSWLVASWMVTGLSYVHDTMDWPW